MYRIYSLGSSHRRAGGGGFPGGYVSTSLASAVILRLLSVANIANFTAEFRKNNENQRNGATSIG